MKSFRALLLTFVVAIIAQSRSSVSVAAAGNLRHEHDHHELHNRTYVTRLDHFNPRSNVSVEFNYVENIDYYEEGGPIYIYVSDNGRLTTELLEIGLMHDIAHDTNAALITSDNRYHRRNVPTANASIENLRFLTAEQTISDLAHLIRTVRADLPGAASSRVILWGSGWGATLATWTRQKFPHLVQAVWASSGVFRHTVSNKDIFERLSRSIERVGGADCAANVTEAFVQISRLVYQRNVATIRNAFKLCFALNANSNFDIAFFYASIHRVLIDYINLHHAAGIRTMCSAFDRLDEFDGSDREFQAYSAWWQTLFTDQFCLDASIFSRIDEAQNVDWDFINGLYSTETGFAIGYPTPSRPTLYQHCTQLGQWATTVNARSLFDNHIGQDTFHRFCSAAFGSAYDYTQLAGAVDTLNTNFGGDRPAIDDVLYVNGQLDPSVEFGVLDTNGFRTYVFNISDHGKSADLFSISSSDAPALRQVKQNIVELITEWSV